MSFRVGPAQIVDDATASGGRAVRLRRVSDGFSLAVPAGDGFKIWVRHKSGPILLQSTRTPTRTRTRNGKQENLRWVYDAPQSWTWPAAHLVIHNWTKENFDLHPDSVLDWSAHFDLHVTPRRVPSADVWRGDLRPDLRKTRDTLRANATRLHSISRKMLPFDRHCPWSNLLPACGININLKNKTIHCIIVRSIKVGEFLIYQSILHISRFFDHLRDNSVHLQLRFQFSVAFR